MKRRLALLPIVVLFALTALAIRQTVSDIYTATAALDMASWLRPGYKREAEAVPDVIRRLDRAVSIVPENAWALEFLGSLQLETMRGATDPEIAVGAVRASRDSFRRVLRLRPTSPLGWTNLVAAKHFLGELDAEFFSALEQSIRNGRWEPQVQLFSLQVGLGAWDRATPAQREMILQIRDRAVQRDPGAANAIFHSYSRLELACDPKTATSPSGRPCPTPRK